MNPETILLAGNMGFLFLFYVLKHAEQGLHSITSLILGVVGIAGAALLLYYSYGLTLYPKGFSQYFLISTGTVGYILAFCSAIAVALEPTSEQ